MQATLIPLLILLVSSCGTMKKLALRSTTPVFKGASDLNTRERNWEFFRESAPANIKLTELLYLQDPGNTKLLSLVVKGYAGYAYAVPETLFFQDELAGVENSPWKKEAIDHYTRALDYGVEFLKLNQISVKDILNSSEEDFRKKLDDRIEKEELPGLLYFGQAWGSLINLQRDNVALVSQVPRVKIIIDSVCGRHPDIDHGVCDIFYAQYEASRPRMLGGNPEKARELFLKAIQERPLNLLMRMSYVQFVLVPAMDQEAYEKEALALKQKIPEWENFSREDLVDPSPYEKFREWNLFNAIAKKRFEIVEKYKSKIF